MNKGKPDTKDPKFMALQGHIGITRRHHSLSTLDSVGEKLIQRLKNVD